VYKDVSYSKAALSVDKKPEDEGDVAEAVTSIKHLKDLGPDRRLGYKNQSDFVNPDPKMKDVAEAVKIKEAKEKEYNDKLAELLKKRQEDKLTQVEYDAAMDELKKQYEAPQEGAEEPKLPKDVAKREKEEIKNEAVSGHVAEDPEGGYLVKWRVGSSKQVKSKWFAVKKEAQEYLAKVGDKIKDESKVNESNLDAIRNVIEDEDVSDEPIEQTYLTYTEGTSNKFHQFAIFKVGDEYVAANAYGRIGKAPQAIIFARGDKETVSAAYDKKIASKTKKGYVQESKSSLDEPEDISNEAKAPMWILMHGKDIQGAYTSEQLAQEEKGRKAKAENIAEDQLSIVKVSLMEAKKISEAKDEPVEAQFGPGKYYIGDPCYVMKDALYDQWGEENDWEGAGVYTVNGQTFACSHTAHGDGEYKGSDGKDYGVDAGIIGVVPEAMFDLEDNPNAGDMGRFVDVTKTLTFHADGGVFSFSIDGEDLTIDTKDEGEGDEESSWDKEEEDEGNADEAKKEPRKWMKKAVNPKHKGYCTPTTKKTCTPRRKALAMRFKKMAKESKVNEGERFNAKGFTFKEDIMAPIADVIANTAQYITQGAAFDVAEVQRFVEELKRWQAAGWGSVEAPDEPRSEIIPLMGKPEEHQVPEGKVPDVTSDNQEGIIKDLLEKHGLNEEAKK
jgi:predicted DNA-binding WGR domain protein